MGNGFACSATEATLEGKEEKDAEDVENRRGAGQRNEKEHTRTFLNTYIYVEMNVYSIILKLFPFFGGRTKEGVGDMGWLCGMLM